MSNKTCFDFVGECIRILNVNNYEVLIFRKGDK